MDDCPKGMGMEFTREWFTSYCVDKLGRAAAEEERQYIRWHRECVYYELRRFCAVMARRPLNSVLDIGPGNFFFADAVKELFPHLTYEGVEPESETHGTGLFRTSTHNHEYKIHCVDIEKEVSLGSRYDAIVCFDVIEHLLHDPARLVCNVHHLLTDTGVFFLTTDNVARLINFVKLLIGANIFFPLLKPYYVRHNREYTLREMLDLLQGTGFRVLEGRRFNFRVYWPSWGQTVIYSALNVISEIPPLTRHKRHMFFACAKNGAARLYRPAWLYQHSYGWGVSLETRDVDLKGSTGQESPPDDVREVPGAGR